MLHTILLAIFAISSFIIFGVIISQEFANTVFDICIYIRGKL